MEEAHPELCRILSVSDQSKMSAVCSLRLSFFVIYFWIAWHVWHAIVAPDLSVCCFILEVKLVIFIFCRFLTA
jgi:hypothetical protein